MPAATLQRTEDGYRTRDGRFEVLYLPAEPRGWAWHAVNNVTGERVPVRYQQEARRIVLGWAASS